MSTVVQTSYAPQIRPGLPGMIVDQVDHSVQTWQCETAAGIPFGVAVSYGTGDSGVILGGSKFIGISVRDVTQVPQSIDPLVDTADTLDYYGYRKNVGVLSRGHIWVLAGSDVAGGDSLFYDTTSGGFSNSASGLAAYGSIKFAHQPAVDETIVLNGATWTFKASGATGDQSNIGPTLGDTIVALAAGLNGSATAGFSVLKYQASPPSPGGAGQGSGADTLLIADKTVGTAGNALAITTVPAGATKSAATLLGGTAAATAIVGGRWLQTALAGTPARVGLSNQT